MQNSFLLQASGRCNLRRKELEGGIYIQKRKKNRKKGILTNFLFLDFWQKNKLLWHTAINSGKDKYTEEN